MIAGTGSIDSRSPGILLIGYGNEGRCDDGLGPRLAAAVAALECAGVTVESSYQLNIEAAAAVAEHHVVVFADATITGRAPFEFTATEPSHTHAGFTTHSVSPAGVLGLAREVFGADTIGYTLAIRGYRFHEFGESLSAGAVANLNAAVAFLREVVAPGGRLDQPTTPFTGPGSS